MAEQDGPRRGAKVRRFTAARREAFLEFLARTGNFTAAAAAVGIDRSTAEQRRKRDADFEIACREALAAADRALAGAQNAFDAEGQGDFSVIKRSRSGRTQIIRAGSKRWTRAIEAQFFAALAWCGNVSAAARAVGFSEGCIWHRRRTWPAFHARMEEALDEAEINIEFRLASMASDLGAAAPEAGRDAPDCDPSLPPLPFDADLALRYLKWRQQKRTGPGGRRGKFPAERPIEEVMESIMTKVEAIDRHENKRLLEEGWSQDEETGRMIPPGWVRLDPPSPDTPAGEPGS